jgi:uncharacterized protein (DUF362 family)
MKKIDRRNFLMLFMATTAGIFLTSCFSRLIAGRAAAGMISATAALSGESEETDKPADSETVEENSNETGQEATGDGTGDAKSAGKSGKNPLKSRQSIVGIAGSGYGHDLGAQVERAVYLAGGLGFIKKGSTVLLKPNFNTGDPNPASTNPEVIRHVIRLVKKQDPGTILVGDRSSFWTSTLRAMEKNGAYNAAVQEGAEPFPFDNEKWINVKPFAARSWPNGFKIPEIIKQVDYVISIPVIKTHSIAVFSMAIKNWVGILEPLQRTTDLHLSNGSTFGNMLAELNLARVADFVVMDGTRVFVDGGPTDGTAVDAGLIVASSDVIANDTAGLAILKTLGTTAKIKDFSVWQQPQIMRAVQLGLGAKSTSEIRINSENVKDIDLIRSNLN